MQRDEVAIIGAACLLPGAASLAGLRARLRAGHHGIGQPGPQRSRHSGTEAPYLPMGYLDRIDLFDHRFFGLSLAEAELMDPHQRLVLQLAHQAVESSGYAPGRLRGSRTAVVLGEASSGYETLSPGGDPLQLLGSSSAALAARVSYLLDLAGPALVVDTACSSGLAALAQAMSMLRDGSAELALAGGLSVQPLLTSQRDYQPLRGVESPTATCRPFDARADGTAGGEGGGIVVLKLLRRAVADRDNVLGVLKGIAVNHNGYRAASMGAPSQVAQAEVIAQAWRDAGVTAGSIGYVECHGSATPLGDVVEVDALQRAFRDAGVPGPQCAIGSVKGIIGHLGNAAGVAGLLAALCAVRYGELYPAAYFQTPNPLIDFSGPVQVSTTGRAWPGNGATPRRAGVSSLGLTGTNVHAVLEQAPAAPPSAEPSGGQPRPAGVELVTVSARSGAALARYCQRLARFAASTDCSLRSVAHAMNRGRDDHPHRLAFVVADHEELVDALRGAAGFTPAGSTPAGSMAREPANSASRTGGHAASAAPGDRQVVLLFSADAEISEPAWARLCDELPELRAAAQDAAPPATDPRAEVVRRQWALYRLVTSWGLTEPSLVGNGTGNLVVRCAQGELSPADAVLAAARADAPDALDRSRLSDAVQAFRRGDAVLVELAADGVLSREMGRLAPELASVALLAGAGRRGLLEQFGRIYQLGAAVDWDRHYDGAAIPRIQAPTYPFEPVSCWVTPAAPDQPTPGQPAAAPATTGAPARSVPARGAGTERHIATVWQDVLKATDVHPESDYFALGGTSITGISVLRRLEQELGVTLGFGDLYAHRTVRSLARRADELRATAPDPDQDRSITPVPRGAALPLSFGQEQLWYLDCLNPGSPLYNIPADLRLRGPLDLTALCAALRDLAQRHEVLRTCIRADDGAPAVHVLPDPPQPSLVDLSTLDPRQRDQHARRLAEAAAVQPFDLAQGPLWRATVLKLGEDDHVLLLTYHHIVFDGWSPSVFFRDLFQLYRAHRTGQPATLPELPIQYADYAAWQRSWLSGRRLDAGLAFWRDQLAGLRPGDLPLDRPRPRTRDTAGDLVEFGIDAELAAAVRAFSQRHGVTTFVTMLAVVDALLHRWAGLRDVVVGVGTSGRVNPATHNLVGYFNNLPPFRTTVHGELPFTALVRRCADTVAAVLDHEEIPLEKIVSAVCGRRDPARHPLFDVAYTYQNAPPQTGDPDELTITRFLDNGTLAGIAPGTAKFDLTFGVTDQDDGPMQAYIEYASALFDRQTVRRLAAWLPAMLRAAMADPAQRIDQLPAAPCAPAERSSVLTGAPPAARDGRLVTDLVAAHIAARPDHPAVICDGRTLSYRELNRMANRLARRLVAAGVAAETVVPVVASRGVELAVGWLAVAKAGGAYLPIDPALPRQRIDQLLADARTGAPVVGELPGTPCLPIELAATDEADDADPTRRAAPTNLAYLAYTSGSTGRPHGCEVEHRNLLDLVLWYRDEVGLRAGDNTVQVASPGFDIAALEVWAGLCTGASVHFLPTALEEPRQLMRWLAARRIAVAFLPTTLAEIMLAEIGQTDCAWPAQVSLRVLSTGGDQLRVRPPAGCPFRLLNMYGPTECAVVSTAGTVPAAGAAGTIGTAGELPDIGRPIAGASVYLVDDRCRPVGPGELGELCVAGGAVGRGYHRLPSLTATRFLADPLAAEPGARLYRTGDLGRLRPDGTIEFCGRLDDQVEIRGQRVEPAEIERVLVAHHAVREALVAAVTAPSGSVRLLATVTTGRPAPTEHDLLAWTARALPAAMVPSRIVLADRLPRTATGKLDRKGMKEKAMSATTPGTTQPGTTQPRTTERATATGPHGPHSELAERVLVGICAELLNKDGVTAADNFFELGGDSVLGVRVAARAAKRGVFFTLQQLLEHATLGELAAAAVITDPTLTTATGTARAASAPAPTAGPAGPVATAPPPGPIHLTPTMYGFLDRMPPAAQDFVEVYALQTSTRLDGRTVRAAVAHVLARHEPLRYRFRHNRLGWQIGCAEPDTMDVVDVQVLPPMSEQEQRAVLTADLDELRAGIDLERGPALRARYYDRGHSCGGWLVFVIHHFVFDAMATVVLLDDLDAALADLTAGRALTPPEPSRAWARWSQHLRDLVVADELAGELAYWTSTLRAGAATLRPAAAEPGSPGILSRTLPAAQTADVLRSGSRAQEAAMCAAACALGRWRNADSVYVMTEGAATPNLYRPAGRPPAVGWFTTVHPLLLPVEPGASVPDCLPAITDTIRSVPNDGVGYGILRHLTPDSPALAPLRSLPEPDVMVVHGTNGDTHLDSGVRLLRHRPDLLAEVPTRLPPCFPLELLSTVTEDGLQLTVLHDGRYGDQAGALADEAARAFAELAG